MKQYNSYKDSGVKWLGEIPSHWETRLLKYCCSLKGRIGWNGLKSDEFEYSSYAYLVTGQDFIGALIDWSKCYQINQKRYEEDPYIQLVNGDILITKDGSIGKVAKVAGLDKPACLNSGIFVIKQLHNLFDQNYLYWALNSSVLKEFNRYTQTGATIAHLYQNVFEQMPCLLPPIKEQEAIANYLDSATSKIDEAIAQQQKMIDLLNERKQIIINNAVTKGLDPNVKMKDSGVEWIGEVPEHWQLLPYRYLFYNLDKLRMPITADQRSRNNPQYDYYGASGVIDKIDFYNVDDKVLLIGEDGANLLMRNLPLIYKAEGKFWVNNHAHILKPIRDDYDFLAYVMEAADYTLYITGSAQPKLSQSNLNCVKLPIPPIPEQKQIVDYLSKHTRKIDDAIKESNNMISLLQERKQIIINEVVTGKVKVG